MPFSSRISVQNLPDQSAISQELASTSISIMSSSSSTVMDDGRGLQAVLPDGASGKKPSPPTGGEHEEESPRDEHHRASLRASRKDRAHDGPVRLFHEFFCTSKIGRSRAIERRHIRRCNAEGEPTHEKVIQRQQHSNKPRTIGSRRLRQHDLRDETDKSSLREQVERRPQTIF